MFQLSILLLTSYIFNSTAHNFDFGKEKAGTDWQVIVDGVMGGLSTGKKELSENSLLFTGTISLANNGGFSSVRTPFGNYDLSPYQQVKIKYRSNGGVFGLMLERYQRFYYPYYDYKLPHTQGEWQTIRIDLSDFDEIRLADKTGNKLQPEALSEIIRIGFMKLDKKEGDFMLEVEYVNFF